MDETILEQELVSNQRFAYHKAYGPVVISRPTPAVERKIAEQRRKVYHSDLKDTDVLTSAEVMKMLVGREVWSPEKDARIQELTTESAELMARLTALGYESLSKLYLGLLKTKEGLVAHYGEDADEEISDALERVFDMSQELQTVDLKLMHDKATTEEGHELVEELHSMRIQMNILNEFGGIKAELGGLIETHTQFFGDTIEARAARTERMARVFYCVLTAGDKHETLWDQFEDMWNDDPDNIAWLSSQLYYFEYGITDEYAKALQTHGFMARVAGTEDSSENSQGHPQSNSDGESPESKSEVSSPEEVLLTI